MRILVDADALPTAIKDILLRAGQRLSLEVILVANKNLQLPLSESIKLIRVAQGFDVVDDAIVELVGPGDLVVTADILLAARIIEKGGQGLSPRGEAYTADNIQGRLAIRNLLAELRDSGQNTGGPPPLSPRDRHTFARQLDRFLTSGQVA